MSSSSNVSLGAIRLQAQQRADMENNQAVSTPEWNNYITNSYKALYDMLVSAYGNEYYQALPYQFAIGNVSTYALPDGTSSFLYSDGSIAPKFYKLCGVDLQCSSSPTGWATLRNFEFIERNKYGYANTNANYLANTNLRYKVFGNGLYFSPIPPASQVAQIWYVPAPTNLQFIPICSTTASSTTVSTADVTGLVAGQSVFANNIPDNTVIVSVDPTLNTFVISNAATSTLPVNVLQIWIDSASIDGISGWEEFIIIDAAIKAGIKQENDINGLVLQRNEIVDRIKSMAEGRDIGQAYHVSDALSINTQGFDNFGDGGMGGGC